MHNKIKDILKIKMRFFKVISAVAKFIIKPIKSIIRII
jgi:hypothetical protein